MSSNVAPGTTTPGERKRRHHHRSRNGCISCKQRHMRCDESKPFWLVKPKSFQPDPMIIVSSRNCLKNGSSCGYTRVEAPTSNIAQPLYTATSPVHEVSANSILSAYLNQPSNAVPGSSAEPGSFFNPGSSGLPHTFGPQSPLTSGFDIEMMDPFNALPASMSHKSNMLLNHCESRCLSPNRHRSSSIRPKLSDPSLLHDVNQFQSPALLPKRMQMQKLDTQLWC